MGFRNAILLVEDGVELEAGDVITDLLVEDGSLHPFRQLNYFSSVCLIGKELLATMTL